jgi:hypothetical protein
MERLVTVEFGPSRSKRFGKAVVEARKGGECTEVEPGRYLASFALGADSDAYTGLARLLERVRHWRATEVREGDEPLSAYHAKEMAWCASSQLKSFGTCQFRFYYGVLPAARFVPCSTQSGPSGKARIRLRRWCSRSDSAHTALRLGGSPLPTSTPAGRFPTSRHKHGESQPLKNHPTKAASA